MAKKKADEKLDPVAFEKACLNDDALTPFDRLARECAQFKAKNKALLSDNVRLEAKNKALEIDNKQERLLADDSRAWKCKADMRWNELQAVNETLREKIEELRDLHADFNNLSKAHAIASIKVVRLEGVVKSLKRLIPEQ